MIIRRFRKFRFLILIFFAMLPGCRVGPPYIPPATEVPDAWKTAQNDADNVDENICYWWEIFHDETLDELENQALENNHDVFIAFERVVQTRALAGIVESQLYPQINLSPNFFDELILYRLYDPDRIQREHRRTQQLPLNLNYEVDLWGKLEQAYESVVLEAEAEEDAYQTVLLMLTTDLAESYYYLRTLDAEIDLLASTIETYKKGLEILKSRYQHKIINYLDVSRGELEYSNAKAEYQRVKTLRRLEENKIAVLIGVPPSDVTIEHKPIKGEPPKIPAGVPSDVLLQRPDIAEAERTRAAEHAKIGVAYASFFPSFTLTGALGWSSPNLKDFLTWKSRLWVLGANANQVVFDGGALFANLAFAISKFREADEEYQQVVLVAFQDVEDALTELEGLSNQYADIEESIKAAKNINKIAFDRYNKGVAFYLDVVISERDELTAERTLIKLQGERYEATIELIKALGGSWATNCIEVNDN